MAAKKFALIAGSLMLVMGLAAMIPALSSFPTWLPRLQLETSYGAFLDLFAMNIVNKVALLAFGIAGILVARGSVEASASVMWSRVVFVVMGIGALLGAIPATSTLFGYWPLFGAEIAVHALFAAAGAYFGFAHKVTLSTPRTASQGV